MRMLRHGFGLLIVLLITAGIAIPASTFLAPVFGREVFVVRGQSMGSAIPIGSVIIVGMRPIADIQADDVVTWRGDNGVVVTHRVVERFEHDGQWYVRTRGDANDSADALPVPASAIVGVVEVFVPIAGYLLAMLSTPAGLISWLSFGLALLAVDSLLAAGAPARGRAPEPRTAVHPAIRHRLRKLHD
jgi:signal peptidase I